MTIFLLVFSLNNPDKLDSLILEAKREVFNNIKKDIIYFLKNNYYLIIDTNDINYLKETSNIQELKRKLNYIQNKYHSEKYDYLFIEKKDVFEITDTIKEDNGIDSLSGKIIPGSLAMTYCYYFSGITPSKHKYIMKSNDVCFYYTKENKIEVYISSYEINRDFLNIILDLINSNQIYDTIVIDFRDNYGGLIDISFATISLISCSFLVELDYFSRDTIYYGQIFVINQRLSEPKCLRYNYLKIITNKNSASASEFITFKLKEKIPKIILENKDGKTTGKRTTLIVLDLSNYYKKIKDNFILNLRTYYNYYYYYYYPHYYDSLTDYVDSKFEILFSEYKDLIFVGTISVLLYKNPFNDKGDEFVQKYKKKAKGEKVYISFIVF
jgi:hypothetical protein